MDAVSDVTISILLVGIGVVAAAGVRVVMQRIRLPALLGYIGLGLAIALAEDLIGLPEAAGVVVEFLARAGIIALLFRIGIEADLRSLAAQLRGASVVWVTNVALSAGLGFAAARWVLDFDVVPSLVAAIALSATSVGIPTQLWREADALDTDEGARFLDVAELDDVSAVVLMAILFSTLPEIRDGTAELGATMGLIAWFVAKLALFGAGCAMFAHFLEERITSALERLGAPSAPPVIGIGFVIAAVGALLGFSEAIGAFFAGLAFSRDPERVKIDASIGPLHDLLSPWFFIGVGASIPIASLDGALWGGVVLTIAAIVGKVAGGALPNLRAFGWTGAGLIGVSLVPRAEISLVVAQRGRDLGQWATPDSLFSAIVVVSLLTTAIAPLVMRRWLLPRFVDSLSERHGQ